MKTNALSIGPSLTVQLSTGNSTPPSVPGAVADLTPTALANSPVAIVALLAITNALFHQTLSEDSFVIAMRCARDDARIEGVDDETWLAVASLCAKHWRRESDRNPLKCLFR